MKTGFIGLGQQGKYLAINLVAAGHDLMVYDVRREPLEELVRAGATVADSPRAVGRHAEVTAICVLDDAQLEAVVLGPNGVLTAAAPDSVVVIHSTVEPSSIAKIAAAAAPLNIEVVDAPVSGGETGARGKTMSYMVGGSDRAVERCLPLFQTSGRAITRTGLSGSGIRAKLHPESEPFADFLIRRDRDNPFVVQASGIESPGLTSCLAVGELVGRLAAEGL